MKNELAPFTEALDRQNDILGKARNAFLGKEAERKHFESNLIKNSPGKSHAEKVVNAQATVEWLKFHKDLARLEAIFEFQKLKFTVLDREWLAQHSANKSDQSMIKRQVG